jgi:hypothetical protein
VHYTNGGDTIFPSPAESLCLYLAFYSLFTYERISVRVLTRNYRVDIRILGDGIPYGVNDETNDRNSDE